MSALRNSQLNALLARCNAVDITPEELCQYANENTRALENVLPTEGYFVMLWGGGGYGSVAWFKERWQAEQEVSRLKARGLWSGMPPKVEPA